MTNSIYAEYFGFVYLWYDVKRKMYYIGSHMGQTNDGYICSQNRMRDAYRRRPHTFKRRILYHLPVNDRSILLQEEKRWLDMIDDHELKTKYYNNCRNAWGLSPDEVSEWSKKFWDKPGSREAQAERMRRQSKERRESHSEKMKAKWQDPEFREKIRRNGTPRDVISEDGMRRKIASNRTRGHSEATREKMRQSALARCNNPEYKAKFKERVHNPESSQKRKDGLRKHFDQKLKTSV